MDQIWNAVLAFDAHLSPKELACLCYAIHYVRSVLPNTLPMKEICFHVQQSLAMKSVSSVLRCIQRAVARVFAQGDSVILISYQKSWMYEVPAPNEFVRIMACRLWMASSVSNLELLNTVSSLS